MKIYQGNVFLLALLFITIMAWVYCQSPDSGSAESILSGSGTDSVAFICRDREKILSLEEIMSLDAVMEEIVVGDPENGEKRFPVRGAELESILNHLGENINDLYSIRLVARDGYMSEIPQNILIKRKIIFVYEMEGRPLFESSGPIRIYIPQEEEMYWVKQIVKVVLIYPEEKPDKKEIKKIFFMETKFLELTEEDYDETGNLRAVKVSDLLAGSEIMGDISLFASDGLSKNEDFEIFKRGYIITKGDDSFSFRGKDIQKGMHVKGLVWIGAGETGYFSVAQGSKIFRQNALGGEAGIPLRDLTRRFGLKRSEKYILEAIDGKIAEIAHEDMERGIVYIMDNVAVYALFEGLFDRKPLKNILSIKAQDQ